MFISSIHIKNYRLFDDKTAFNITGLNVPDGQNIGSGLNILVGENGCGKTSILDAVSLAFLEYKSDSFSISDMNDTSSTTAIQIISDGIFSFDGFVPKSSYKAKGFEFEAKLRAREARGYMSSILVTDQRFMRADGETKPEDGKPELRVAVNNPWRGKRFKETDVLFLDKNRTFQTRSGTYNQTRFDRLMEDYGHKFLKTITSPPDYDKAFTDKIAPSDNEYLTKAVEKFKEIAGYDVRLSTIDNFEPFKSAFFSIHKDNNQQIRLDNLGSGYGMIFTLLYSFYLAEQSGKKMVMLIDEPEMHLHPKLQEAFAKFILDLSKDAQIFITTHSPTLLKQLMENEVLKVMSLVCNAGIQLTAPADRKLPYLSANEINFVALGYATEEYHNELYEELYMQNNGAGIKPFDIAYFQNAKGERADCPWFSAQNQVSKHTHIRNQIHHRGSLGASNAKDVEGSIEIMRSYL